MWVSSREELVHVSGAPAALQGTLLDHLALVASGACIPGPMELEQMKRQFFACYHPQGTVQTIEWNTLLCILWKRSICCFRASPWGVGFWFSTGLEACWGALTGQKSVAVIFLLSLYLAPSCWYLSKRSLYICLASQFLWLMSTGHLAPVASRSYACSPTELYIFSYFQIC